MTKLRTYLSVKLTVLALLVGRVVLGAFAAAVVLMVLGLLGSAWGGQGTAPADAAPAPTPTQSTPTRSTPMADTSGMAEHERPTVDIPEPEVPAGMAVHLDDADCAALGLKGNHAGQCLVTVERERRILVAISAPDDAPMHPGVALLLRAGYDGEPGDDLSAVYAPVDLVLFDQAGTWTVTVDGLARCEHGATRACTGSEWVR